MIRGTGAEVKKTPVKGVSLPVSRLFLLKVILISLYASLLIPALGAAGWFLVRGGSGRAWAVRSHLAFYPDRRSSAGFAGPASFHRSGRVSPLRPGQHRARNRADQPGAGGDALSRPALYRRALPPGGALHPGSVSGDGKRPEFSRTRLSAGWGYAEVFGRPFDVGHYYLYTPKNRPVGPLPALVFLHGSLGNFKTYPWVWSCLVERAGLVIIAPSYGFGNWRYEASLAVVSAALADAATQVELDPERIYLAGLSNGGLGVSHLALAQPERFRGLIFLSPVMDSRIVSSPAFLEQWRDRPVLVLTGAADERIPLAYVQERVAGLRAGGVAVTERVYPGETHFLFFSQSEPILAEVQRWLADIEK